MTLNLAVNSSEFVIDSPEGQIFAKRYTPEPATTLPPIVLLHDSLGSVTLWRDFPEQLAHATKRVVIAYDRIGFGRSSAYPHTIPLNFVQREATNAFNAVLDFFAIDQFVVFGHSVGGGMALVVGSAYPEHCVAVISEAAQSHLEEFTLKGVSRAKVMFAEAGQLERLAKYHGAKAQWVLDSWIDSWLSDEFANWSIEPELKAIKCPILSIHGSNDEFGSKRHPEFIAETAAAPVTVALLEGFGHVPHKENAERVLTLVVDFLADS